MMLFSELNIVSISISFVVLAFIREANCNDFLKSLFTLNKPFFTAIDISRQSLSPALTVTRTLVSGCKKPSIGITYSFRPRLKASSSSLALAVRHDEKYDDRGQIIIERGQFFKTYLYGAGYDQAHFKIMERGHLTS